jgi:hypothetical protein
MLMLRTAVIAPSDNVLCHAVLCHAVLWCVQVLTVTLALPPSSGRMDLGWRSGA